MIVDECIDCQFRSGVPGLLCKSNLGKTYDHVNWEWSLFWSSIGSGDKGEEDKTVVFLSALDEEHRRWDKIEGCVL
jgi:hypothetical protein